MIKDLHKLDAAVQKYRDDELDKYLGEEPGEGECYECLGDFPMGKLTDATIHFQDGHKETHYYCNACYKMLRERGDI